MVVVVALVVAVVAARTGYETIAFLAAPALVGAMVLARTRHGRIEVARGEREVRVVVVRLGPTIRGRLSFDEVESVHSAPSSMRSEKPAYVLRIGRIEGPWVDLLTAEAEAELRDERARVERFLVETGALEAKPLPEPSPLVALAPSADAARIEAIVEALHPPPR